MSRQFDAIKQLMDELDAARPVVACHPKDQARVIAALVTMGMFHLVKVTPTPYCAEGSMYLMKGLPLGGLEPVAQTSTRFP